MCMNTANYADGAYLRACIIIIINNTISRRAMYIHADVDEDSEI